MKIFSSHDFNEVEVIPMDPRDAFSAEFYHLLPPQLIGDNFRRYQSLNLVDNFLQLLHQAYLLLLDICKKIRAMCKSEQRKFPKGPRPTSEGAEIPRPVVL